VKETIAEDAQKVIEFAGAIQELATEKTGDLLKVTMDVKRKKAACLEVNISEAVTSEAAETRGNSPCDTIFDNIIDLDSSSTSHSSDNIDDIAMNKVKLADDVYEPMYPSILERMGGLSQRRIDVCKKLPVNHWLLPPYIQPLQTIPADE